MEISNYRELKEAFVQVKINEANKAQEQQLWNEVQAYSNELISEGYDLSEMTWDDMREAYMAENFFAANTGKDEAKRNKPASNDNYAGGAIGQLQRLGDKVSGNQSRINKARSYETSVNNIRDRKIRSGNGNRNTAISQNDIAAETAGRNKQKKTTSTASTSSGVSKAEQDRLKREADRKRRAGQQSDLRGGSGSSSGSAGSAGSGGSGGSGGSQRSSQRPAAPAPAKQTGDKAKDMKSWATANPELARRQKERQRTRGTSASTNPMMADLKSRAPKPSAQAKNTPSITGNKASSFISKGGSKATQAPAKPTASAMKPGRLRAALDSVRKESADQFDIRFQELLRKGFYRSDVMELMVHEATKHIDEEEEARKKRNKKINKVEMCPTIDESVLEVVFEEWIDEMVDDGYDLSECYETDLFKAFLTQISEDAGTYYHLEYLGRISLEEASALSVEDQMRVSQAYFKKRNARSEEEKEAEKKRDARSRSKRSAMHSKPDPYKARAGESD